MVKRISDEQTEKMEKADQKGVYKIACGQCESVYIGETGRKFSTRMMEHVKCEAKRDEKLLFGSAMMRDTPAKLQNRDLKHSTQRLPPGGGNLRSNWKL